MKDEFLATLSHELRTPLNAILGWTTLLEREDLADTAKEGIEVIARNARVQKQLIEDLLDMSRIISGKIRLDVQRVELSGVIEAAVATVRPAAETKGVAHAAHARPFGRPGKGRSKPAAAGRVEPAQQCREIHAQRGPHTDFAGAGKFAPGDRRCRQRGGDQTRIPPACLRSLSAGRFLNRPPLWRTGAGPVHRPAARRAARRVDPSKKSWRRKGRDVHRCTAADAVARHARKRRSPRVHPATPGMSAEEQCDEQDLASLKILVVDDEQDARDLMKKLLERCNAVVTVAASAQDALAALDTLTPDVIVSDIGMPTVDGYEFIRKLRADPPSAAAACRRLPSPHLRVPRTACAR